MSLRKILPIAAVIITVTAIACTSTPAASPPAESSPQAQAATAVPPPTPSPEPTQAAPAEEPVATATPRPSTRPNVSASPLIGDAPTRLTRGWSNTDFTKHSVPFFEIISGGVPRDGIPPIDNPSFLSVSETPEYMEPNDPVIALEIDGNAKAYPLDILQGHEIVNDELNGTPVAITYCPLCNTAIVFDRRVDDQVFDFGVSGNLRNSDLIMWDRQTDSWWQQITGESIVGEMTGTQLEIIPAPVISWVDFRESFPDGQLLSRETGSRFRNYDDAPYDGYDDLTNEIPFLFMDDLDLQGIRGGEDPEQIISGKIDSRLLPMERVVSLNLGGEAVAYPFALLQDTPVLNDTVGGQDVAVFYVGGTLSAFQGDRGASNRVVGSTGVYDPFVNGEKLNFSVEEGAIVDDSTGSKWNILGRAVEGPMAGTQLKPIVHANHFWFAWAAFNPETTVREASDFGG